MKLFCSSLVIALLAAGSIHAVAQNQPLLGRPSPPQPQQTQGVEYFAGTWRFSWTGRETALTPGPRSGQTTFTQVAGAPALTANTSGTVDEGSPYKESGTLTWNDATKTMTINEKLAGGAEVKGDADWKSPIAMNFESASITVKGQTLKVKRTYSILSATSFSIMEEISTDGSPYQRVGTGSFTKLP